MSNGCLTVESSRFSALAEYCNDCGSDNVAAYVGTISQHRLKSDNPGFGFYKLEEWYYLGVTPFGFWDLTLRQTCRLQKHVVDVDVPIDL